MTEISAFGRIPAWRMAESRGTGVATVVDPASGLKAWSVYLDQVVDGRGRDA
jgi:hypothetical protein